MFSPPLGKIRMMVQDSEVGEVSSLHDGESPLLDFGFQYLRRYFVVAALNVADIHIFHHIGIQEDHLDLQPMSHTSISWPIQHC